MSFVNLFRFTLKHVKRCFETSLQFYGVSTFTMVTAETSLEFHSLSTFTMVMAKETQNFIMWLCENGDIDKPFNFSEFRIELSVRCITEYVTC